MLDTTNDFKSAIMASQRYTDAIVVVSFEKENGSPFGTPSASSSLSGYPASQLSNGRIRVNPAIYTGATTQDGETIPILLQFPSECKVPSTGWKSANASNSVGGFVVNPTINVAYSAKTASAVWVVGTPENFPVDFTISINGTPTVVTGNTRCIYTHKFTSVAVNTVSVVITKISAPLEYAHVVELGIPTRVYFDRNDIIDIGGTEEIHADNGSGIGNVSANECSVRFNNTSGIFDISSSHSPLSSSIRSGIQFKPFIGVEISNGSIEMVAMGSYTSDDWLVTIGTGEFTLQGFDYMETLRTMQFPYIPLLNDPTYLNLSDYMTYVVLAAGFDCDLTIYRTITLLLAYSTSEYIKEWLQKITEAIIGVAYINRLNTLQVRELPFDDNVSRNPVKQIWLDNDIIINVTNPQKFSNTYSSLIVSIPVVSPLSAPNVAYIKELVFTSTITISNIKFSQPIYYIESIEIRGSSSVMIDDVKYNSFSCELTLSSSSLEQQTVEIIINACAMITIKNDKTFTNPVTINNYTLEKVIDTPYIQSLEMATTYSEEYFLALGDPSSNFEVETYCNPAVELCDRITINSQTEGILVDIAITKQTWTWDGALSAQVEGRKLFNRG